MGNGEKKQQEIVLKANQINQSILVVFYLFGSKN